MTAHSPMGDGRAVRALALIGFMGAGKTAVGRALAARLDVPFVDTDSRIEERHGRVAAIFADHGEQGFRRIEREEVCAAIAEALAEPRVLSLGGGAVLSGDVRDALAGLSHVVWLTAPADVLWSRVGAGTSGERPLAADEPRFRRLLEERSALYESVSTDVVANDGGRSPMETAAEIVRLLAAGPATKAER